jgi:hypothetical protein
MCIIFLLIIVFTLFFGQYRAMTTLKSIVLQVVITAVLVITCSAQEKQSLSASSVEAGLGSIVVNLHVDSLLSPQLSEWRDGNMIHATLKNVTPHTIVCKADFISVIDNILLIKTLLPKSPVYTIRSGETVTLNANTMLDTAHLRPIKKSDIDPARELILRSGEMQFCLNVSDTSGLKFYGQAKCAMRTMFSYKAPSVLSPVSPNGIVADTVFDNPIVFRWTRVQPVPKNLRYILSCYPMGTELFRAQAIRSNPVLFSKEIYGNDTTYSWSIPDSVKGRRIVWNVRALGKHDVPLGGTDGYSDIGDFIAGRAIPNAIPQSQKSPKLQTEKKSTTRPAKQSAKVK